MASEQVLVPDIGDFDDVPVIEVLVSVGDEVAAEDPLVVLESDKATMEVPSPSAGKVAAITVAVGDKVKEGSAILSLEVSGDAPEAETAPEGSVEQDVKAEESSAAGDVEEPKPIDSSEPPASPQVEGTPSGKPSSPQQKGGHSEAPPYASPGVRRLARELGVDLSTVTGSGRKGRITKEDVQKAKDAPQAAPAADAPSSGAAVEGLNLAPWPKVNFERFGEVERHPLTRIQKISGPNLARNWVMIPHVTHNDEADITELEAFRKRTNAEQDQAKVTMVALLAKAVVASLKAYPVVNSSLDGDDLVLKRYYNIGFAADTPNGLVVPVIKDADKKGILEIAKDLTELSGKARAGKLSGGDMQGATFTISSLGGIGGTSFTPIVNAPEVAILGVTRSAMKPVWNGSEFVPRLMVPLSLSYDHRVIDGALAARFTAHLVNQLSDLRRVLL
ncbi:pyruvate dehydrogenase E2 component (dihydrolipoamide acetyltransferase) [Solirubrobacter pauli]|uniref:Acetyltransferase component of pyruvate dehydrogenase complex n=1 Tax=Solirubrobacter pauli TaxID=166793 RepID=A0A660KZ98_9ACTN|nr:dihydrolipoyllysine-residue acetyltransferase [Solirubrobacter pauli]RKQ86488.1 pyruvate dehydrogenase E2 component (dihydrolipoamide acetyltransferase) [Solirubrobacter pauli]